MAWLRWSKTTNTSPVAGQLLVVRTRVVTSAENAALSAPMYTERDSEVATAELLGLQTALCARAARYPIQ